MHLFGSYKTILYKVCQILHDKKVQNHVGKKFGDKPVEITSQATYKPQCF